jgi:hypothetical protein
MSVALNELNLLSEPRFNIALPDDVSVAVAFDISKRSPMSQEKVV